MARTIDGLEHVRVQRLEQRELVRDRELGLNNLDDVAAPSLDLVRGFRDEELPSIFKCMKTAIQLSMVITLGLTLGS